MNQRPSPSPPPLRYALRPPPPPNPDATPTEEIPVVNDAPAGRRWPVVAYCWTLTLAGALLTGSDTTPLWHGAGIIIFALGTGTTGYYLHKWKDTT